MGASTVGTCLSLVLWAGVLANVTTLRLGELPSGSLGVFSIPALQFMLAVRKGLRRLDDGKYSVGTEVYC